MIKQRHEWKSRWMRRHRAARRSPTVVDPHGRVDHVDGRSFLSCLVVSVMIVTVCRRGSFWVPLRPFPAGASVVVLPALRWRICSFRGFASRSRRRLFLWRMHSIITLLLSSIFETFFCLWTVPWLPSTNSFLPVLLPGTIWWSFLSMPEPTGMPFPRWTARGKMDCSMNVVVTFVVLVVG